MINSPRESRIRQSKSNAMRNSSEVSPFLNYRGFFPFLPLLVFSSIFLLFFLFSSVCSWEKEALSKRVSEERWSVLVKPLLAERFFFFYSSFFLFQSLITRKVYGVDSQVGWGVVFFRTSREENVQLQSWECEWVTALVRFFLLGRRSFFSFHYTLSDIFPCERGKMPLLWT